MLKGENCLSLALSDLLEDGSYGSLHQPEQVQWLGFQAPQQIGN